MGEEEKQPLAVSVRVPSDGPTPPGVDYVDELGQHAPVVFGPDDISRAVGSPVYEERKGFEWAKKAPPVAGWPGEPFQFGRYYRDKSIVVDVWKARSNCSVEERESLAEDAEARKALAWAHGLAYVAIHVDETPDPKKFEEAMEQAQAVQAKPEPGTVATAVTNEVPDGMVIVDVGVDSQTDEISGMVGDDKYMENFRPEWARVGPPTDIGIATEMDADGGLPIGPASRRLMFTRGYWTKKVVVDRLPARETLAPNVLRRLEMEAKTKKALAERAGWTYIPMWANAGPEGSNPSTWADAYTLYDR